jgi:hypothetical protein
VLTMHDETFAKPCKIGMTDVWTFTDTNDDTVHTFTGTVIGAASSHKSKHDHRPQHACKACRWNTIRIFRVDQVVTVDAERYVVVYGGITTKTGETNRWTIARTSSPYTVIEVLTQSRNDGEEVFLPRTARTALSEAAARDSGIEQAWVDRP